MARTVSVSQETILAIHAKSVQEGAYTQPRSRIASATRCTETM